MADITAARPCPRYGDPNEVYPGIYGPIGIAANLLVYGGAMVGTDANGNMNLADAAGVLFVAGVSRKTYYNRTTDPSGGAAGAVLGEIVNGAFPFTISTDGGAITNANRWQDVYVVDDQTVSLSDAGGRLRAGYILGVDALGGPTNGMAWVQVGAPSPFSAQPGVGGATAANKARAVATSIDAYTGSGTNVLTETTAASGLGTQDGVTLAVGDVVFIQEGTTNLTAAKDAGPWVVTSLGSASVQWVLTRPSWWTTGQIIIPGTVIELGGEGTTWAGTEWKTFAAKASVVGTTAPAFWVRSFTQSVTLVTGFVTKTNVGIRSTTESGIGFQPTNFNGAALTVSYRTGAYSSGGAATAVGVLGTGSVSITALVAAGTFNTSDVGTGLLTVTNW
jgi:hypothetical protein